LGLQARLTALTALGLAAMYVVMGFIGLRNQAASLDMVLQQRVALAQTVAAHVGHRVGDMLPELGAAAEYPGFDLSDDDLEAEQHALADLYRQGAFYDVFLTDARGIVLAVEPQALRDELVGADLSKHPHILRALETGQPQVSGVIPGVAALSPLVSLVVPLKNAPGEVVGLIGGALDPSGPVLSGFIASLALGQSGYAQVIDGQGMVIASTIPHRVGKPTEHAALTLSLLQRGEPTVVSDAVVVEEGKEFHEVIAFAPIPRFGWGVTVEQDRAEALAPIIRARNQIMAAAGITLSVAIFFVWLTTRRLIGPVQAIAGAARRVAGGDLDTPVAVAGYDEVAELGRDFETMRERLCESRQRLERWNAELEQKVEERTRQIMGLQRATHRLTADLSLEATLEAIVEESQRVFGANRCAVYVLDPGDDEAHCLTQHGLSPEYVEVVRRNYLRLPGSIARATGKPVVVADAQTDPRLAPVAELVRREGFRTILILPFVHHGQTTGAFGLYHDQPRDYTPEEISLGEAFAAQAASAVANAQLHDAVQRELAERVQAQEELRRRITELERFNRLAVGRELRMKELKERIRELEERSRGGE
jgi:HAMP domain-containing protein